MATETDLLQRMLLIRAYDDQLRRLLALGAVARTGSTLGHEAAAVGVVDALRPDDLLLTHHRSAAHLLARGADPARLLGELMGRSNGYWKPGSGELQQSVRELGAVLTAAQLDAELSLAPGVALAQRQRRRSGVVACVFGDGGSRDGGDGILRESLRLAVAWQLPLLYLCDHDPWAAGAPRAIDHHEVDGLDLRAVRAAAADARAQVERSGMPFLLVTRTRGRSGDDGARFDPSLRRRDPIVRLASHMHAEGRLDEQAFSVLQAAALARITAAQAQAAAAPEVSIDQLLADA